MTPTRNRALRTALRPEDDGLQGPSLFDAQPRGTSLDRFLVQLTEVFAAGQREGGFFIMIGRKPGGAVQPPVFGETRAEDHSVALADPGVI